MILSSDIKFSWDLRSHRIFLASPQNYILKHILFEYEFALGQTCFTFIDVGDSSLREVIVENDFCMLVTNQTIFVNNF